MSALLAGVTVRQSSFQLKKFSKYFFSTKRCISSTQEDCSYTSVDQKEVNKFSDLSKYWWDTTTGMLHALNDLRVPLVRDAVRGQLSTVGIPTSKPLTGTKILDVGCGGGILCEPLARLGGSVMGLDANSSCISVAADHSTQEGLTNIEYIHGTVEDMVVTHEGLFDAVVASEVVEHVSDWAHFVKDCCRLVKTGGSFVLTTINRTQASYLLAIVVAENILNLVPKGTHTWDKFISPEELQFELSKNGCCTRLIHGMLYNPISQRWAWSTTNAVNYALHAVKHPTSS